jgi:uncharacterized protein (DUF1697 family)
MKYVAFLRGINVGGNNIIKMADLKAAFEKQGFTNVTTYINSGNVLFDSDIFGETELGVICEKLVADNFSLNIPVCVISTVDLILALSHAPNGGIKHLTRNIMLYL